MLSSTSTAARVAVVGGVVAIIACVGVVGAVDDRPEGVVRTLPPSVVAVSSPPAAVPSPSASGSGVPLPLPEVRAAYLADLDAVDPRIVGNHSPETMVSRGRAMCGSIRQYPNDRKKLVELANYRFTAPTHPNGFGTEVAGRILVVVHRHLCPEQSLPA